jgi:hypothetical protein
MRYTAIALMILMGSVAQAEVHDFNNAITEASVSEKRLHRRLMRILQGDEVSIAEKDALQSTDSQKEEPFRTEAPADLNIRLVRR